MSWLSVCMVVCVIMLAIFNSSNVKAGEDTETCKVAKKTEEIRKCGDDTKEYRDTEKERGFKEYKLDDTFVRNGGEFSKDIQKHTYNVCKKYDMDYTLIVALIETESSYKKDAVSHCNALGYMQVMEMWHKERMKKLNVNDLMDGKSNIIVGVDYLAELMESYSVHMALSIYNRGFRNDKGTGALDLYEKGIKSTAYSRKIIKRAKELEKELEYEPYGTDRGVQK